MKYNLEKLRLIHLFSGVGAPEMALKKLGVPLDIIGFAEIDKYAIQSYKAIHGDIPALGDVSKIELLPECDMVVYGSPCLTGDTLVEVDNNKYITIKKLASYGTENRFNVLAVDTSQENKRTIVLAEGYNCHMTKRVNTLIKIKRGMSCFKCTPEHKILLPNCEWVEAKELKDGDYIWGSACTPITVEILHVDNEPVYDLTVPKHHNFIIKGNFCVHNCQDFSCAGNQKGLFDENGNQTRSGLLLEVERLMENAKREGTQPKFLLMENVKNLVGKQFKSDFDRWLEKLAELGYNNYWQVLNAKDYGIPQNRERVFVMSILREYDAFGYKFPSAFPLKKCLRDVLEQEVDDKYYLSEKLINYFLEHRKLHESKGTGFAWKVKEPEDVANCLSTNASLAPTDNTIYDTPIKLGTACQDVDSQAGAIFDTLGISPTLVSGTHGYANGYIKDFAIGASRGRNPENPSDSTVGAPTEQRLEINTDGVSNTLTTVSKDNLVLEKTTMLQLPHGSNSGGVKETAVSPTITTSKWEYNNVLVESDDTDVQFYNKYNDTMLSDVAPTQTTNCGSFTSSSSMWVLEGMTTNSDTPVRIGNIYGDDRGTGYAGNVWDQDGLAPTLTTMTGRNRQPMIIDDTQGFDGVRTYEDYSPTLRANRNGLKVESDLKIRRLTPLECWRLMGFSDEDFKKAKESGISDTQAYKQAGNSIVVDVLYYIFKMLLIEEYDSCKKVRRKKLIDWK